MCGIHYKDTIRAIEDIKLASDLGAVGVQLSAPIHNGPTEVGVKKGFEPRVTLGGILHHFNLELL